MGSSAIPPAVPPPPDPNDVTPQLGPASLGSDTPMGKFRAVLNTLSGGGIPAIQERQAADFAKRRQDAQVAFNRMRDATTYSTHARNSVSKDAPFGINVLTGKPATAEDVQGWHNDVTTGRVAAMKNLPKDAKPIAQKLFEVVHHITGHKGDDGPAGLPAAGDFGGETGRPSAITAPPQSTAAPGPAVPPPPGQTVPPMMQDATLAAPENTRAMGVENALTQAGQATQQQNTLANANIGPKTQATTAADLERIQTIMQLPQEQRLPAMMSMGVISPALMHPIMKVVPNDPSDPSKGNHYESRIPLVDMMGRDNPAAPLSPGWAGAQKSGSSQYNPDTGVTTNTSTTRKVLGNGRPASISAPPGGPTRSKSLPETSAKPTGRIASMAQDYADEGKVPAAKDSPAVETYMRANNMVPGVKPTADEIKQADNIRKVEPMVGRLSDFLEKNNLTEEGRGGMFSPGALYERSKVQKAWEEYSHGLPPEDKQLGQLVKYAAAVKIMGAATWMTIGRSKYTYSEIVQHLPETTDTPAQLYDKVNFFKDMLQDSKDALPQQLLKPRGPSVPPPPSGGKKQFYRLNGKAYDAQTNQEIRP